jgi:2-polyprenyl-3-methyl-5-hydroxy-6-metoxy-1,4-benzoquinol methylase
METPRLTGDDPVFSSFQELAPEQQAYPARYRFCLPYLTPQDKVLDCACGCGYGSALLAEKVAGVTAIDPREELIAFAGEHWARPNIQYQVWDISRGPLLFGEGAFSAIVCLETISHLPEPQALLGEFRRVMEPEGLLFLSAPQAPSGKGNLCREFTLGELCARLEEAGLPVSATLLQKEIAQFSPAAPPLAGLGNLIIAGQRMELNPLIPVIEQQYALQRTLRREVEKLQNEVLQNSRQLQRLNEKAEKTLAGKLKEIRELQAEVRDWKNSPGVRCYSRLQKILPGRKQGSPKPPASP